MAGVIVWAIPLLEIVIAAILISKRNRIAGFYASFILMILFTVYLLLMLATEQHLPCSCGGVIQGFSWKQHIFFNLFFIGIAGLGIFIYHPFKLSFMKKKIFYVGVIAVAMSLSAFSVVKKVAFAQYYWFPLDGTGVPLTVNNPTVIYMSGDPYNCLNWGLGDYCSGAFTSYSGTSAPYRAAGVEVMVDFHYY